MDVLTVYELVVPYTLWCDWYGRISDGSFYWIHTGVSSLNLIGENTAGFVRSGDMSSGTGALSACVLSNIGVFFGHWIDLAPRQLKCDMLEWFLDFLTTTFFFLLLELLTCT